ncbi:MAG: hypothetical protein A2Y65_01475 [Deltaproteobacteria bacterium RBG_13_52_11]|nr:MAG: hypothetical protein A2Y65_01475 [Deltaproteobacteria bacterium RBG_13_52_11]
MAGGKKGCLLVLVIVGVVGLLLYPSIKGTRSQLMAMNEKVKASWAQVENQLQRRMDLIPNYVETVKSYAPHEQGVYGAVTQLHLKVSTRMLLTEKIAANNELTAALDRLLLVTERYPDLKTDQTFIDLQGKLADNEDRIAKERMRYNEVAGEYNTYRQRFPTVIVATLSGFSRALIFAAPEQAQGQPGPGIEPSLPLSGTQ